MFARPLCIGIATVILTACAGAPKRDNTYDSELDKKVFRVIERTSKIKVGQTRKDLLTQFTTEGGMYNRCERLYVYRECSYIKVDVEFKAVGDETDMLNERPEDIILKISKPFLELCHYD